LEALADARERYGRSVRLLRRAGTSDQFEFVHDQMNAYLAASWLVSRPTVADMREDLATSKVWKDTKSAQEALWDFVVPLLQPEEQAELWETTRAEKQWRTLRDALEERGQFDIRWDLPAADSTPTPSTTVGPSSPLSPH